MKYKDFSCAFYEEMEAALAEVKKTQPRPVAAFDADGTLWNTDLGENFFQYKIDHQCVPLPSDPWQCYRDLKKKPSGPADAYLWLAQILDGTPIEDVRLWAKAAVDSLNPLPLFEPQKKLIQWLKKEGVQVYIVTASIKWAVDAGAHHLELSPENVLGIETEVESGKVTSRQKGIITYKAGKTRALLDKTGGQRPFFCSGNSNGDTELLSGATHLRLCVSAAEESSELYLKEMELFDHGKRHGWHTHRF